MTAAAALRALCVTNADRGAWGNRDFNWRVSFSWFPEKDSHHSFRTFMTGIPVWIRLSDLQPHEQCAAIVTRRGGSACEMARMITPQEIPRGGCAAACG